MGLSSKWILRRHMINLNGLSFSRQSTRKDLVRLGGTKWVLKSRRVVSALRLTMISVTTFRHAGD